MVFRIGRHITHGWWLLRESDNCYFHTNGGWTNGALPSGYWKNPDEMVDKAKRSMIPYIQIQCDSEDVCYSTM